MFRPLLYVRDVWQLWRISRNTSLLFDEKVALYNIFKFSYEKKDSFRRNLLCKIVKILRQKYPYQIKDFSEAKQAYEEYFLMQGSIKSIEEVKSKLRHGGEVYLTCFRSKYPSKGHRFCEYSFSYHFSNKEDTIYKVIPTGLEFSLVTYLGVRDFFANVNEIQSLRYSTIEEINKFKQAERKAEILKKTAEALQEEISEIYEQRRNLLKPLK